MNVGDIVLVTGKHEAPWLARVEEIMGGSARIASVHPGEEGIEPRIRTWCLTSSLRPATYVRVELGLYVDASQWGADGGHADHWVRDDVRRYIFKVACDAPKVRKRRVVVQLCSRWRWKILDTTMRKFPVAGFTGSDVHDLRTSFERTGMSIAADRSRNDSASKPQKSVGDFSNPDTRASHPRNVSDAPVERMSTVSIAKFRGDMKWFVDRVQSCGYGYYLTRRDVPVAKVVPVSDTERKVWTP